MRVSENKGFVKIHFCMKNNLIDGLFPRICDFTTSEQKSFFLHALSRKAQRKGEHILCDIVRCVLQLGKNKIKA